MGKTFAFTNLLVPQRYSIRTVLNTRVFFFLNPLSIERIKASKLNIDLNPEIIKKVIHINALNLYDFYLDQMKTAFLYKYRFRLISTVFFSVIFSVISYSQTWERTYSENWQNQAISGIYSSDGSLVTTGYSGLSDELILTLKLDPYGNPIWSKILNTSGDDNGKDGD